MNIKIRDFSSFFIKETRVCSAFGIDGSACPFALQNILKSKVKEKGTCNYASRGREIPRNSNTIEKHQ